MERRKRLFLLFLIVFFVFYCLSFPLFAESKTEVNIEGDNVKYQDDGKVIEADGDVRVTYKDLYLTAGHIFYYSGEKKIVAEKGFCLERGNLTIEGDTLNYNLNSNTGEGKNVELRFEQSVYLSGKVIKIRPEKMELNDASFNACGLHSPHYNVTASQIILYPDIGWVVSYWGLFWYSGLPLMPIPTYLYDVKAEQRGRPNTPPFPEIGKNSDEGTFFHERLTWHVSENWNDRLTFSYMSNKGWGGGVDANYVANKSNEGYVRLFANPVDQWYGGITHFYSFGEDLNDKVGNPATIWPVFSEKHYALQLDLSYNEFNNYQRVGIVPGVTLYSNLTDVWNTPLKYKWSVGGARIREKASALELNRSKIDLGYLLDFPLWQNAVLTPGVELNSSYYEGNRQWIRQMGTLSLHQSFPGWGDPDFTDLKLKAQHYFKVEGNSPFLFEQYKYQPLAEFFAELSTNVGSSRVGIRTDHFLPSWNPNDIDYFVSAKWHCYDIIFTYRSLRGETTVSFGLEPPK